MEDIETSPDIQVFDDSDRFWDLFWQHIDKAEDLVFIATYDMDHKLIAGITLQKLINACKRGVKAVLIIDDLNYYASEEAIKEFKKAGGVVIRNNPLVKAPGHLIDRRYQRFFNRNHQKVMLVDSHVFCGSLNVADPYSGWRYGNNNFRDLNILLRNQNARDVRSFFLELLLQNQKYFPDQLKGDKLVKLFDDLNQKYEKTEAQRAKNDSATQFQFLSEMPPEQTQVTTMLLEIINEAQENIKIIQPYVQNVEEVEEALFQAIKERDVKVEIITARNRDQPIYKSFLNSDLFSELLSHGCKVYEEPYKFLHMKAVSVDDGKYLTIGSLNQDHCSFY